MAIHRSLQTPQRRTRHRAAPVMSRPSISPEDARRGRDSEFGPPPPSAPDYCNAGPDVFWRRDAAGERR